MREGFTRVHNVMIKEEESDFEDQYDDEIYLKNKKAEICCSCCICSMTCLICCLKCEERPCEVFCISYWIVSPLIFILSILLHLLTCTKLPLSDCIFYVGIPIAYLISFIFLLLCCPFICCVQWNLKKADADFHNREKF